MKKAFILITTIFLVGFKQSDRKAIVSYNSDSNGTADIKLTLFDNNTFKFNMEMFEFNSKFNSTGIWKTIGDKIRLTYQTDKPDLKSLFDEKYDENNGFQVIDKTSVDINSQNKEIWIWGVSCLKKELITSVKTNTTSNTTAENLTSIQSKGKLYKANQWLDTKAKGWAYAFDNPTVEKVEILQTDKNFKVTFGKIERNYKIISTRAVSAAMTNYDVTLNGIVYVIAVTKMPNGTIGINIDGTWQVLDIIDISTVVVTETASNRK